MKCMVVLAALVAVAASAATGPGFRGFASASASATASRTSSSSRTLAPARTPAAAASAVVSRVSSADATAEIVRYDNDFNPDGSYHYYYETNNGITGQENGNPKNLGGTPPQTPVVVDGSYAWTAPEGNVVAITYVADENGYQPQGDAIPTPPPVPAQIARALEWIATHPYTEPKKL